MNPNNPIWRTFDLQHNLIKEYKYWNVLISKNQNKLGRCVVILRRDEFPLSEVYPVEMAEYAQIAKDLERALKNSFGAFLVQHCALMFVDKQIHFHVIPRYNKTIEFAGISWADTKDGDPLIQKRDDVGRVVLDQIKNAITANM